MATQGQETNSQAVVADGSHYATDSGYVEAGIDSVDMALVESRRGMEQAHFETHRGHSGIEVDHFGGEARTEAQPEEAVAETAVEGVGKIAAEQRTGLGGIAAAVVVAAAAVAYREERREMVVEETEEGLVDRRDMDRDWRPEKVHAVVVVGHTLAIQLAAFIHLVSQSNQAGVDRRTNTPGPCPMPGLCPPSPAPIGVLSPLLIPAACSAAFFALCSANLFFKSEGDSNLGFFTPLAALAAAVLPVAARRSASACAN